MTISSIIDRYCLNLCMLFLRRHPLGLDYLSNRPASLRM
nr:MAG TPA: hypothetical protein [Caudoviricetes sp.]DAI10944.1 MAG TPA: hypothetical protein [Caudoviricetes sp.]